MINLFPIKNYLIFCNSDIDNSVLIELIQKMPSSTTKKKVLIFLLSVIAKLNIHKYLPSVNNVLLKKINLSEISGEDFLFFSQNLSLRNRLYCISKSNDKNNFYKIIFGNESNNKKNIEDAKKYFINSGNLIFHFPNVIQKENDVLFLKYDMLPSNAVLLSIKPTAIYHNIQKLKGVTLNTKTLELAKIVKYRWWKQFYTIKEIDVFKSYVLNELKKDDKYKITISHGDLGSENVYKFNNKHIIIDWEKSSDCSPLITDFLGIILGNNSDSIINEKNKSKNKITLKSFYSSNNFNKFTYNEFLLGICFYLGTNFNLAFFLINNFESE